MSTLTIELPETIARQIESKGISRQQIETVFIRVIQLYVGGTPPLRLRPEEKLTQKAKTLSDIRGTIPISRPQDFNVIRQQVITTQIRQRQAHGK
jgi:hypothetical protein